MKFAHTFRLVFIATMTCLAGASAAADIEPLWPYEQNGVQYMSGGIGLDEAAAIAAAAPNYSTLLGFAATGSGEYLSDVHVIIRQAEGRLLLDVISNGPFLLVNLVPGRYQVVASYLGVEQVKRIRVPIKARVDTRFYWIVAAIRARTPSHR